MTPVEWLKANDRRLWTDRPTVKEAREECEKATGEKLSAKAFRELRDEHCEFWFQRHFGRPMRTESLSMRQWSKVTAFIRSHWDEIKGQPESFVVRYLRANRIPANESILAGCSTYQQMRRSST